MKKLLWISLLIALTQIPVLVGAVEGNGTITIDLIPTNETQKLAALSKLGITPPDTGIERVEIIKLENKTETLVYSLDSLASNQNISLATGIYILKVKYKNQKGKRIVDGNGSGYHIESGGTIVVPLYSNTPDRAYQCSCHCPQQNLGQDLAQRRMREVKIYIYVNPTVNW